MQNQALHKEIIHTLVKVYDFVEHGNKLRKGTCPECKKRELWADYENPFVLRCPRENNCGWHGYTKELHPEIFGRLNERFPAKPSDKNATANAYMQLVRGLNLSVIKGSFRQGSYYNPQIFSPKSKGTATVLFEIAPGVTMERFVESVLIKDADTGEVETRKQHFTGSHKGLWFNPSCQKIEAGDTVYIVEACIDALSLICAGFKAVAVLSAFNYPDKSIANVPSDVNYIWALDNDRTGRRWAKKHANTMANAGFDVQAALPPSGSRKQDWNDLLQANQLTTKHMDVFLYQGALLLAPTAFEKALLIYNTKGINGFQLEFDNRWYWFNLNLDKFSKALETSSDDDSLSEEQRRVKAANQSSSVVEICNCNPVFLYFQRNEITDESWYYARISFPHSGKPVKNTFNGGQISSATDFKKRLVSIAPGAIYTGGVKELDQVTRNKLYNIKTVSTVDYVGYSREYECYVFNSKAVARGKVFDINDEDYFEIGKTAIKSLDQSIGLKISTAGKYKQHWPELLWQCHGPKGMVALCYWFGSLFAEQIRKHQESFPFFEFIGQPGSGKSTVVEFLWRLLGRTGWEGFDPSKNTAANRARNFLQVSNMPVVLLEADRDEDTAHAKKFDWEELKPMFNGRGIRGRAMKTSGNETYEPPFRGSVVITQNADVMASEAILSRLIHVKLTRDHHNAETKIAADQLNRLEVEDLSYFLIQACASEPRTMEIVRDKAKKYENALLDKAKIRTVRIAKNHGQMMALVDALAELQNWPRHWVDETKRLLAEMAEDREKAIAADHPIIASFWETYYYLCDKMSNASLLANSSLNHSKDSQLIAVRLNHFQEAANDHKQQIPLLKDLKRYLKGSTSHKFVDVKPVDSLLENKTVRCWIFRKPAVNPYADDALN